MDVNETASPYLASAPAPSPSRLCRLDDVPEGEARGFLHKGQRILVVRREDTLYLYENSCPHRGIPLEWQPDRFLDESGSLLQCATHGALFLIENGECVAGPCAGKHLRPLPWTLRDGSIWLHIPATCDAAPQA